MFLKIFRFPKYPVVRLKWLEACKFNESDILRNRKLYSFHFEDHSYTGQQKNVFNVEQFLLCIICKSIYSDY